MTEYRKEVAKIKETLPFETGERFLWSDAYPEIRKI